MDVDFVQRESLSAVEDGSTQRPKRSRQHACAKQAGPAVSGRSVDANDTAIHAVSQASSTCRVTRNAKRLRKYSGAPENRGPKSASDAQAHLGGVGTTQNQQKKSAAVSENKPQVVHRTRRAKAAFRGSTADACGGIPTVNTNTNKNTTANNSTVGFAACAADDGTSITDDVTNVCDNICNGNACALTKDDRQQVGRETACGEGTSSDSAGDSSDADETSVHGDAMPSTSSDIRAKYVRTEKIGAGTYGVVYKAYIASGQDAGKFVALKKIRLEDEDNGVPSAALWEIASLKRANHANVVSLLDMGLHGNWLYLVFEYVERDLRSYLDACAGTGTGLEYAIVKRNMWQLLQGIHHCHRQQILHRDLKPGNLLIDSKGTLKIADFGMARPLINKTQSYSPGVVTLWYRAPEILLNILHYTTSVDMWSIGCIFIEMATGVPAFAGDAEIDQLYRIFKELGTPSEHDWPGVTRLPMYLDTFPSWQAPPLRRTLLERTMVCADGEDLIQNLLMMCPQHRMSASEALLHPLFRDKRPDTG